MRIDQKAGFRIVIDVVPDGFEGATIQGEPEGFTALASLNDLPDPDDRGPDHARTIAFAISPASGEAGSAVAAVVSAWLSGADLLTERLWRQYGDGELPV